MTEAYPLQWPQGRPRTKYPERSKFDTVKRQYRMLSNERHPDTGGSDDLMAELNVAYDRAKLELGNA